MQTELLYFSPVLPTADMERDLSWYGRHTGFEKLFADAIYAVLQREQLFLHLQWHADTAEDPLLGGSVVRLFVKNIQPLFREFVERGTVREDAFRSNTPWHTSEFGFYDLNRNAIFIVEDL